MSRRVFGAWDDERRKAENAMTAKAAAENHDACLTRQIAAKRDRADKKRQLEQFYIQGGDILYANLPP